MADKEKKDDEPGGCTACLFAILDVIATIVCGSGHAILQVSNTIVSERRI